MYLNLLPYLKENPDTEGTVPQLVARIKDMLRNEVNALEIWDAPELHEYGFWLLPDGEKHRDITGQLFYFEIKEMALPAKTSNTASSKSAAGHSKRKASSQAGRTTPLLPWMTTPGPSGLATPASMTDKPSPVNTVSQPQQEAPPPANLQAILDKIAELESNLAQARQDISTLTKTTEAAMKEAEEAKAVAEEAKANANATYITAENFAAHLAIHHRGVALKMETMFNDRWDKWQKNWEAKASRIDLSQLRLATSDTAFKEEFFKMCRRQLELMVENSTVTQFNKWIDTELELFLVGHFEKFPPPLQDGQLEKAMNAYAAPKWEGCVALVYQHVDEITAKRVDTITAGLQLPQKEPTVNPFLPAAPTHDSDDDVEEISRSDMGKKKELPLLIPSATSEAEQEAIIRMRQEVSGLYHKKHGPDRIKVFGKDGSSRFLSIEEILLHKEQLKTYDYGSGQFAYLCTNQNGSFDPNMLAPTTGNRNNNRNNNNNQGGNNFRPNNNNNNNWNNNFNNGWNNNGGPSNNRYLGTGANDMNPFRQ